MSWGGVRTAGFGPGLGTADVEHRRHALRQQRGVQHQLCCPSQAVISILNLLGGGVAACVHDADRSPQGRGSSHVQEKKNNQLAFKTSQPHPTTTGGSVTLAAETKMLQNQNILVKSPKKFGAGAKKYQSQGVLAKFKKNANKFWAAVDPFWSPPGGVQSQNQSVTPETPVSHHRGGGPSHAMVRWAVCSMTLLTSSTPHPSQPKEGRRQTPIRGLSFQRLPCDCDVGHALKQSHMGSPLEKKTARPAASGTSYQQHRAPTLLGPWDAPSKGSPWP